MNQYHGIHKSRAPARQAVTAVLIVAAGLGLAACGGDSSGGGGGIAAPPPPPPPPPAAIEMQIGEDYPVADGARLVSRSASPALVEIRHLADGQRSVVLREGAADLHP